MGRQMAAGGEWAAWRVPRLMVFLKESVIELGGHKTEGIFRISGDLGAVAELVCLFLTFVKYFFRALKCLIGFY